VAGLKHKMAELPKDKLSVASDFLFERMGEGIRSSLFNLIH
jgi:hypothetical protein